MNRTTWFVIVVGALVCTPVQAQQFPIPTTAAEVPGPPPGTVMTKAYVQTVGRAAYLWGWALVNAANRAASFAKAPEPGLLGGVVPVAFNQIAMLTDYISPDEHFVTCPNQDVVYGFAYADLDKEPIVFQVPDFGDRFWVYPLYDARTDEFSEIGKAYGTKPGFYLMVGPNWKGETPAGIHFDGHHGATHFHGRYCRGPEGQSIGTEPDRLLSAVAVRWENEDHGLEQASALPDAVRNQR